MVITLICMSHPVRFIDDGCAGCNLNKRRYVAYVEKMSHLLDVFFYLVVFLLLY